MHGSAHKARPAPAGRATLRTLAIVGLVIVAVIAMAALVLHSEWAEQRIERSVSTRIDREVALEGIRLRLGWPPRVALRTLRIANPEWAATRNLVDARDVEAHVELWPLLRGRVVVDRLVVGEGYAGLERDGALATWRFSRPEEREADGEGRFLLESVRIGDGWIHYRNHRTDTALHIHVSGGAGIDGGEDVEMRVKGVFRGEPAQAVARAPSVLLSADQSMQASVNATIGSTSGAATGSIQWSAAEGTRAMDAEVTLEGRTLAHLREIFGVPLPHTAPYRVSGRLRHAEGVWSVEAMEGRAGKTNVRGHWSYHGERSPVLFRVHLESDRLDPADFGQRRKADRRLIPDWRIPGTPWEHAELDLRLEARQVSHPPLRDFSLRAVLEQGVLRAQPVSLGLAGGRFEGSLVLDTTARPPRATVKIGSRAVDVGRLVPGKPSARGQLGTLHGRLELEGRGHTVAEVLASSDGQLAAISSSGRLGTVLGKDAKRFAELGQIDPGIPIRCAAATLPIRRGVASTEMFVIDTAQLLIGVEGTVDLGREALALTATPHRKDPGLPPVPRVDVRGTLSDMDVRLRTGELVGRGVAGALLALLNPLLAAAPFVDLGLAEDANCGQLFEQARAAGARGAR
jgi:AsmA family protein